MTDVDAGVVIIILSTVLGIVVIGCCGYILRRPLRRSLRRCTCWACDESESESSDEQELAKNKIKHFNVNQDQDRSSGEEDEREKLQEANANINAANPAKAASPQSIKSHYNLHLSRD